jgi:hypothetical protein
MNFMSISIPSTLASKLSQKSQKILFLIILLNFTYINTKSQLITSAKTTKTSKKLYKDNLSKEY